MDKIEEFKQQVKENIAAIHDDKDLKALSRIWSRTTHAYNYTYNFTWTDRPIIQFPQDIVALQEIIMSTQPDVILETGIAHGGSLCLSASMLLMLDVFDAIQNKTIFDPQAPKRFVIGIDIDIREHNLKKMQEHKLSNRIKMIQGSSTDEPVIKKAIDQIPKESKVMVVLDSNHTHEHVLAELQAYAPLVSVGCYCVVFDTSIEDMPKKLFEGRPWGPGNNPKTAVHEFLKTHPEYSIDESIEDKLLITVAPDGWLKRILS